jgi:hypothetical protein
MIGMHHRSLSTAVPWQGGNERSRATALSQGRPADIVVLVKNEEVIPCTTDSERYLMLHRGRSPGTSRSETGGVVHAWLRVQKEGVYGLDLATTALATELLSSLAGPAAAAAAASALGPRAPPPHLGVLGYACDPACLRSLTEDNLRVGLRHLRDALGGPAGLDELLADGGALQALLLVCWGAAPVQAGGRSAERKYVDLHVHLSPVNDALWLSDAVRRRRRRDSDARAAHIAPRVPPAVGLARAAPSGGPPQPGVRGGSAQAPAG